MMLSCTKTETEATTTLRLEGILDDDANIANLFQGVKQKVIIDLSGVERMNSASTRDWVEEIEKLLPGKEIIYQNISVPLVRHFNIIKKLQACSAIVAFMAPYHCPTCDRIANFKIETTKDWDFIRSNKAPPHKCPDCGQSMEFDDVESHYFGFLQDSV